MASVLAVSFRATMHTKYFKQSLRSVRFSFSISNKYCSYELSICQRILKKIKCISFHKNIGQHNCFQH